ncbi:MAG: DUF3169 family protein [Lachnospiraceae bacterium]|nr:DUF3169 family protein [Lachnospiraceae bacterium]
MNDENRMKEIKKEDSKKIPLFIVVFVLLSVLGGITGYMMASGEEKPDLIFEFFDKYSQLFSIFFSAFMSVSGTVCLISGFIRLGSMKKLWKKEDERDDNWDIIEKTISRLTIFTSVVLVLIYFLYGCSLYNVRGNLKFRSDEMLLTDTLYKISFFLALIMMLALSFGFFFLQKKIVDFEKIMNPEKKGSLFDLKFQKKWYESFDEAEKKCVGIASYKAFTIVNTTCITMIIVFIFLGMIIKITILPLLSVVIIWIVQIIAFGIESEKAMGKLK